MTQRMQNVEGTEEDEVCLCIPAQIMVYVCMHVWYTEYGALCCNALYYIMFMCEIGNCISVYERERKERKRLHFEVFMFTIPLRLGILDLTMKMG